MNFSKCQSISANFCKCWHTSNNFLMSSMPPVPSTLPASAMLKSRHRRRHRAWQQQRQCCQWRYNLYWSTAKAAVDTDLGDIDLSLSTSMPPITPRPTPPMQPSMSLTMSTLAMSMLMLLMPSVASMQIRSRKLDSKSCGKFDGKDGGHLVANKKNCVSCYEVSIAVTSKGQVRSRRYSIF